MCPVFADQFEQFNSLNIHPKIDQKYILSTNYLIDILLTG